VYLHSTKLLRGIELGIIKSSVKRRLLVNKLGYSEDEVHIYYIWIG